MHMRYAHACAFSSQQSAVSSQLKAHATRTVLWHRFHRSDITQIKRILTCFIQKLIADSW